MRLAPAKNDSVIKKTSAKGDVFFILEIMCEILGKRI